MRNDSVRERIALKDNVLRVAKEKKIPLYKLEEDADIARGSISKWNEVSPSLDKVYTVSKLLNVPIDQLLSDEKSNKTA